MECSLFYCATGNMAKLKSIAANDRTVTGKKFLNFITSHDFSSVRGRRSAEKNAYSLLSKRQYTASAAFFLLAKPPMLKTALEIIVSQLNDFALAFFIARLVEANVISGLSNEVQSGLTI